METQEVLKRKKPGLQAEQSLPLQTVQSAGQGWQVKSTALKVLAGQLRTQVKFEPETGVAKPVGISVFLIK